MQKLLCLFLVAIMTTGCFEEKRNKYKEEKGFQVSESDEDEEEETSGLPANGFGFKTQPRGVLMTDHPAHRLTPIFKVNIDKETKKPFTGNSGFHYSYNYSELGVEGINNWNGNFMPGFAAVNGYNLVNVSHFNVVKDTQNTLFAAHVLINNLYFPAYSNDTLNGLPVERNFYLVSVYDEDTNQDGFVNFKDLRRFYQFDLDGKNKMAIVPPNYSVLSSEYDPQNDLMYITARLDENKNGQMDLLETAHIFWLDLKTTGKFGVQYDGN